MPCLLDTSVIVRLNKYRLCDEALKKFGIARCDLLILSETDHHLQNNSDRYGRPIFSTKQLTRCEKFCNGLERLTDPFCDANEAIVLTKKQDVRHEGRTVTLDNGEAQLFAATRDLPDSVIWTADNKSLIALSRWPGCEAIHNRLQGRVYCIERIVRDLILEHGFSEIAGRIIGESGTIGKALNAGEHRCCNVLKAAEQELQAACKGLLAA